MWSTGSQMAAQGKKKKFSFLLYIDKTILLHMQQDSFVGFSNLLILLCDGGRTWGYVRTLQQEECVCVSHKYVSSLSIAFFFVISKTIIRNYLIHLWETMTSVPNIMKTYDPEPTAICKSIQPCSTGHYPRSDNEDGFVACFGCGPLLCPRPAYVSTKHKEGAFVQICLLDSRFGLSGVITLHINPSIHGNWSIVQ